MRPVCAHGTIITVTSCSLPSRPCRLRQPAGGPALGAPDHHPGPRSAACHTPTVAQPGDRLPGAYVCVWRGLRFWGRCAEGRCPAPGVSPRSTAWRITTSHPTRVQHVLSLLPVQRLENMSRVLDKFCLVGVLPPQGQVGRRPWLLLLLGPGSGLLLPSRHVVQPRCRRARAAPVATNDALGMNATSTKPRYD